MTSLAPAARLSLTSLRGHKRRFAGTFVAVLLGVAFLAGTLVMGDTLRAGFDKAGCPGADGVDVLPGVPSGTEAGRHPGPVHEHR
ncbi:hypothetical protein AB0I84_46180, partial [Streptomyces spectabilis]|uniref:hypothetical protein n=1 Tax=Streptomyces spectabilis TaxID=68270 RepID=UPI0033E9EE6C